MSSEQSPIGISSSLFQAISSTLNKGMTNTNHVKQVTVGNQPKLVVLQTNNGQAFIIIPNYSSQPQSIAENTSNPEGSIDVQENQSNNLLTLPLCLNSTSIFSEISNQELKTDEENASILSSSFHPSSTPPASSTTNTKSFFTFVSQNQAPQSTTSPPANTSDDHLISSTSTSLLCPICADHISGFHYGIYSCESCKGFFKRSVQNKKEYVCRQTSECQVDVSSRKKCPSCRFEKCKEAGMRVEAVRPDRTRGGRSTYENVPFHAAVNKLQKPIIVSPLNAQKYFIKYSCSNEGEVTGSGELAKRINGDLNQTLNHRKFRIVASNNGSSEGFSKFLKKKNNAVTLNHQNASKTHFSINRHTSTHNNRHTTTTSTHTPPLFKLLHKLHSIDSSIHSEASHSSPDEASSSISFHDNLDLDHLLHLADHCLYTMVRWARSIPHFTSVSTDDQILLLQNSWCQLLFLNLCFRSTKHPHHLYLGRHHVNNNNNNSNDNIGDNNNSNDNIDKNNNNNNNNTCKGKKRSMHDSHIKNRLFFNEGGFDDDDLGVDDNDDRGKQFFLTREQAVRMGVGKVFNRLLTFSRDLTDLDIDQLEMAAIKVIVLITPDVLNLKNERQIANSQEALLEDLTQYSKYKYPEKPNRIGHVIVKLSEVYKTCVFAKETLLSRDVQGRVPECSLLFEFLKGDDMLH